MCSVFYVKAQCVALHVEEIRNNVLFPNNKHKRIKILSHHVSPHEVRLEKSKNDENPAHSHQ